MTIKNTNRVVKPPRRRIIKEVAAMSSYVSGQELYEKLLDIKKQHELKDVTIEVVPSYGNSHELCFSASRLETDAEYEARLKKQEDAEREQYETLKKKYGG